MLKKELLFDYFLNASPDVLVFFDSALQIQGMSKVASKIFSFSGSKERDIDLIDFFKAREIEEVFLENVKKVKQGKKSNLPTTVFSCKAEDYVFDWHLSILPEKDFPETVFFLKGVSTLKEYELSKNIQELQYIFANLPGFIFLKDENLAYKNVNNNFIRSSGCASLEEVIGKTDFNFSWKDQAVSFQKDDMEVLRTGKEKTDIDNLLPLHNGSVLSVLSNKSPLLDKDGKVIGILGVALDITGRKEQEYALHRGMDEEKHNHIDQAETLKKISKEVMGFDLHSSEPNKLKRLLIFLRTIVANMPGNVYWKDENSMYLGCNNNIAKTANLSSRAEILGKDDSYFEKKLNWPAGTAARFRQDDIEVINSRKPKIFEDVFVQADSEKVVMLTTKTPIFDDHGKAVGILAASMDITQLKQQEADLKKAKEEAEAANLAKSEFIANMSHDVKTPLSGIISISEALSSRVQEEYRELAQDILHAGQHLMTFFENCIELSKLESASIRVSKETFGLKHLIDELVFLFLPATKAKGLELHVDYDEKIPRRLIGGRITLYRILLNLVGNAVKFTSKGSVTIRAELSKKSTSTKAIIKFTVIDTGIGIPANKQALIFERFARLTPSYQGTYEGSGIGLYIVQEFVKSMGGEIHVKSQEGKGSQLVVVLPLEIPLLEDAEYDDVIDSSFPLSRENLVQTKNFQTNSSVHTKKEHIKTGVSPIKILLVEDSLMAQKGTRLLFSSLGCEIEVASLGKEAIALFKPGRYDVVLMDIGLPDMKGYKVSEKLREMEEGSSFCVPILGLSAHATQDEKHLSAAVGMAEMLSKPLLIEQARAVLIHYVPAIRKYMQDNLQVMEEGMRVIDLEKVPANSNEEGKEAWGILDELVASLPESRTEIEKAYQARDISSLLAKVHRFHGDVCYTKASHLLDAVRALEVALRDEKRDKNEIDTLYANLLKAMETLEKTHALVF
jgi:two-component system aerobic respiration control sensor histidine kinase ArcB